MTAPNPHPLVRRAYVALAVALAGALTLAACGGGDTKDESADPGDPPSSDQPVEYFSPLTGESVSSEPRHPIVVVKIDNSYASAPQLGLGKADLVTEELVEGGITRLAVFFDQSVPKVVGPVRSMRATDIGVVQPANAVLVASGGAGQTVQRVRAAEIPIRTEGAPGFFREPGRIAPYNLMMHLPELVKVLRKGERPDAYLPFAAPDDDAFPAGRPARSVDAVFSGGSTTHWVFRGGRYVNTNSNAAEGDRFTPDTILVLRVQVGDAGYRDPAGNPVPETKYTGKGNALVFHDGKVLRGTWSKDDFDSKLTLSAKGKALKLPPGHVWVELVPAQSGNVVFAK